jgi:hypothetical protein
MAYTIEFAGFEPSAPVTVRTPGVSFATKTSFEGYHSADFLAGARPADLPSLEEAKAWLEAHDRGPDSEGVWATWYILDAAECIQETWSPVLTFHVKDIDGAEWGDPYVTAQGWESVADKIEELAQGGDYEQGENVVRVSLLDNDGESVDCRTVGFDFTGLDHGDGLEDR